MVVDRLAGIVLICCMLLDILFSFQFLSTALRVFGFCMSYSALLDMFFFVPGSLPVSVCGHLLIFGQVYYETVEGLHINFWEWYVF